jgi:hypothetical protein
MHILVNNMIMIYDRVGTGTPPTSNEKGVQVDNGRHDEAASVI